MQNQFPQIAQKYGKERRREKRWKRLTSVLACIVVLCTISALVLPALTLSSETFCGMEDHQHSDECYEKVLACGLEESQAPETVPAHTHTEVCYEQRPVQTCTQEESAGHTHGESCRDEEGTLVCQQEESNGHAHGEECYQTESVLICGQTEGAASQSAEGHVHTDTCYEQTLTCLLEEHTHLLACYSNPDADVESVSVWERSVSGAKLTGAWGDDLAAVALTQLGCGESGDNYIVTDDGTKKGITRYGQWYGDPYGDWNAMFVYFCLNYAGIPQSAVPYGGSCTEWAAAVSGSGLYRSANGYSPIKGDIVFFDYNYDGAADHVGIVTRVSADSFQTAEGDVDDCVRQENHSVGGSGIFGYAALPTNPAVVPENTEMPSTEATAVSANAPANVLPTEEYAQTLTEEGGEVESIAPAEEKIVSPNAGEIVKLRFIPEITHEYAFYSSTTGDTYGYLYDADGEQLAYNDDGGVNSNFKITCTLNAGETYYWGAKWYSSSKTGEITVHLELGSKHIYEENEQGDLICPCGAVAPMSGTSGELTWLFDKETGTISFIGTGSMASYGSSDKAPWDCLSDKIKHVHIEEGVTTVGSCAFQNCAALETVSLPGSMRTICNNAFINCRALTEVNLSGTEVTRIEDAAFQNCYALKTVAPSIELAYIGKNAFGGCRALTEMDLSGTSLKTVGDYAFSQCTVLGSLLVPDTLTSIGRYAFDSCKSLTEMNLSGTGVTAINANTFQYCDSLRKVSLPDTLTSIGEYGFYQCSRLSEIRIPESVQSMGKSALIGCSSLEELRLEAENVTFQQPQGSTKSSFHVTVTGTVDNLSGSLLSTLTDIGCSGITFEGPGYMTAGSWQADYLPTQLQGFSQGEYFFDEQGVFYRIDSTSNTASVFYCPPGISNYTTPKELPAIDGRQLPVPVTGVETNAFRDAADLTALLFEAPESITKLSDRAFYNAVNLASINGQTDADGVLSTFTAENLKSGNMLFWQTKITDSSEKPIDGALDVEKESLKLTISTEKGSIDTTDGTYGFYTGETAKTTITVSNPNSAESEEGTVVRVYFQFDSDDGKMNYAPGTYTVVSTGGNQYTMRVVQTDMPDCYYAELERPAQGDTISIRLESSYPSPSSGGGSAIVWGDILTGKEAESLGGGILPVDEHQKMNWSTVADTFPVTKTEYSTGSSKLVGDGKGGAYISGLSYTIGMSREGTTLEGVGKDYMRYVECVDVLTLPEGATLAEDVLKSIREGTVQVVTSGSNHDSTRLQTADKRNFISITPSNPLTNYKYLENASAALDENGNLVIRWRFRNPDLNTVISDISFRYQVYDNTLLVSEPQADRTYQVHNKVTATQRFMHSGDQVRQAECDAEAKTAQGDLKVSKQSTVYSGYFGGERGYRITARNPGALPYEKMASLRDELPNALYMRPADIAAVFAEDPDHELTITIRYATLCEPEAGQTVSGIDGSSTITNPQNSGSKTEYSGMSGVDPDTAGYEASTITVAWGSDDQLQISVAGGGTFSCAPQADAIKSVLDGLALVVTERTVYTLVWDYRNADGTVKLLPGGAEIQKNVPCVNKDTFMFLKGDAQNQYPDGWRRVYNYAFARDLADKTIGSDYYSNDIEKEFRLDKNWSKDGADISSDMTARQGDILDYRLSVIHAGGGRYDALPLTDHMSGVQALLVPADKNRDADWAQGMEVITDDGKEYYALYTPGTYRNVWTSDEQMADTVEVTQSESGLDTLIKWYFVNYTGNREDTVSYRSYVCPHDMEFDSLTYRLNNESWLNDHQSHRLYANLPGWVGTAFDFDKVIVDFVGDTGTGDRYSPVREGQTVVYRLTLQSPTDKNGETIPMLLTGRNMYDVLPVSIDSRKWSKENVRIHYQDNYTVLNADSWSIEDSDTEDQQYLRWANDFRIIFEGTAYIYVELDFPAGADWQEYVGKYGAAILTNSFHALSAQRSVTHAVATTARVRLQKGVLDTGYMYSTYSYQADMSIEGERLYYKNKDVKDRAVQYYVSLYNGGTTNLYLTDMQDLLPRGFTYAGETSLTTSVYTGSSYQNIRGADGTSADKKYARIAATTSTDENGRQHVEFHFSQYSSLPSSVSYDESRQMCYLKPGEAVDFTYYCRTNGAADSDDEALNIVSMPYYDFNGGGVVVDTESKITSGKSAEYTPNDGGCDIINNGQAEGMGFTGQNSDTQWLTSRVTQIRGDIHPGITKSLTSKTNRSGITTPNPVSADPSDVLTWTIRSENDGTTSISDYVLTDRVQFPYMFNGDVFYTIYSTPDSSKLVAQSAYAKPLFTIADSGQDGVLKITTNQGDVHSLTIGGDPITMTCYWNYGRTNMSYTGIYAYPNIQLSIAKDADGNGVMSLRLPDSTMAIPENGCSQLTLSTYNAANTLENKQYINTSFITPMAQSWDNTTNKGNVVKLETPFRNEELPSVRNSAPVTTSYGYVTSSSKRVTEVGNAGNTATCTDDTNYIVLENSAKQFRYTLTVDNSTPKAMDMLTLIDGLPEVGDHTAFLASDYRFSEFKVSLADDPDISVTVTDKDGNVTTLDAASYIVEYSSDTQFTTADWKGTSQWSTNRENARAIRLKLVDSTGTLFPAGSTLALNFTCRIDDPDVQPGQTAWNSFGYHYSLMNELAELEAAPLKVGVKTPSVPQLSKQVVDHSGSPCPVKQDETFRFLVYPGTALSGGYTTREEWITALGETPYEEFSVTVKQGESLSESVRMQTKKWKWTEGEKYNIVELPGSEHFAFRRFRGGSAGTYTLTYRQAQTQIVTCENISLMWSIALIKENTAHERLSGAVFALYSPNASDQLTAIPEEYTDIRIDLTLEHNGQSWYLADVRTTPADGELEWNDLSEEEYYLLEVKAPAGYNLNSPAGEILKRENEERGICSVTVVNRAGVSLPETGGMGTRLYCFGGWLLLLGAGLLYFLMKREKGGKASCW